jgi:hypothetical protein
MKIGITHEPQEARHPFDQATSAQVLDGWSMEEFRDVANQLCNQMCLAALTDSDRRRKLQEVHQSVGRFLSVDPVDAIAAALSPPNLRTTKQMRFAGF